MGDKGVLWGWRKGLGEEGSVKRAPGTWRAFRSPRPQDQHSDCGSRLAGVPSASLLGALGGAALSSRPVLCTCWMLALPCRRGVSGVGGVGGHPLPSPYSQPCCGSVLGSGELTNPPYRVRDALVDIFYTWILWRPGIPWRCLIAPPPELQKAWERPAAYWRQERSELNSPQGRHLFHHILDSLLAVAHFEQKHHTFGAVFLNMGSRDSASEPNCSEAGTSLLQPCPSLSPAPALPLSPPRPLCPEPRVPSPSLL